MHIPGLGGVSVREVLTLVGTCVFIWQACRLVYPGFSLRSLRRLPLLLLSVLRKRHELRDWVRHRSDPVLAEMLERHPLLPVLADRPYVNAAWPLARRQSAIEDHYRRVRDGLDFLVFPAHVQRTLVTLDDVQPGLRIVIDKPDWFAHEGEVAINLFSGERRLYSLLFTLGNDADVRIAYVGALQGVNVPEVLDIYRTLTHDAHGMRPRDLLFAAFRLLCREVGVERIDAVSDPQSARRSDYFKGETVPSFSYDAAWAEYGGELHADGFFRISPQLALRDVAEIPSRKRAQYRRRYDMLGVIAAHVAATTMGAGRLDAHGRPSFGAEGSTGPVTIPGPLHV